MQGRQISLLSTPGEDSWGTEDGSSADRAALPHAVALEPLIEQRIIAKWGHVGLDWAVGSHACFLEPSLQANPGVVSLCFSLSLCKSDANHALGSRQDMAGKQAAE